MVTGALHGSVLALWLLADHVLSETTTATSSTPTNSALVPTSTFVSPSLKRDDAGLSDSAKVGISVGVTLAAILLIGSIAILCVIRRRNRALTKPQTRAVGSRDNFDDENVVVGEDPAKGKEIYYMSPTPNGHHGMLSQAPDGSIYQYQGGGYPTVPGQTYAPQGQPQAMSYPTGQYGETHAYPGTVYPGTTVIGASQQNGYAGPSNAQYQPEVHLQYQQQQQGGEISWIYPISATSPVEAAHIQHKYLQDYQQQEQSSILGHNQYQNEDIYHVPPPHPHASELPDQRRPAELMGEGHYREAP
ncbi:hypothetical protein E0Z10_g7343 [Xylaria hypoxylon]|uniref:Mid2 domain-containing protein n=1 Tax=Xylaria hypoxylon TaxID=37992 RepID=A0A4Z0YQG1_9PEZI|nr:hypothetical protein E0Z10_g7343 [Xylaria hypoxylon]